MTMMTMIPRAGGAVLLGTLAVWVPGAETIGLSPSATTVPGIGDTVTVQLVLSDGAPFNAVQGYLEWDPAMLRLSSAPGTPLLDVNDEAFAAAPGFNTTTSRATGIGKRSFFTAAGNITLASGPVMTWTFTTVATGSTVVQTRQGSPSDDFIKLSSDTGATRYPAVGDPVTITIGTPVVNQAPSVIAGTDQTITLPAGATLSATVTDDGLPSTSLTYTWTTVSGPGTVMFANAAAEDTTAMFSVAGTYVLRLTASDGALSTSDDITITVNPVVVVNQAPSVAAGADQTITLPAGATLTATVTDDGLPSASLTYTWTTVSGPGTVMFANAAAEDTTATFGAAGTYVLRLTASDGALSGSDDLTITVNPVVVVNQAPVVSAGTDRSITLPATVVLLGSVTDDGLPLSGSLGTTWSRVSGPGMVTFSATTAAVTTAGFSAAGTYVLRLSASDGSLAASDDVTVVVLPAPIPDGRRILLEPVSGFAWDAAPLPQSATTGGRTLVGPYPSASAATLILIPVGGA